MGRDVTQGVWTVVLAAIVLVQLPGCGGDGATTHVSSSHYRFEMRGPGGDEVVLMRADGGAFEGTAYGVDVRFEGVDIDIPGQDITVHEASKVEANGHGGSLLMSVRGHAAWIVDGEFFLGETSYGPVAEGGRLVVTRDGVTVDGEARGALPPAVEPDLDDDTQGTEDAAGGGAVDDGSEGDP